MTNKIDFIIPRVDGGDINWQKKRNIYAGKGPEDLADYRFRDMGTLKYIFRGIEKFTPRVNKVFFVTCGHYPEWLNLNYSKLEFVKHEDYIPKAYLPTFSSHTIELNFHRIKGLSEHFVYFNDDTFIIKHLKESDFFENGLPKQIAGLSAIGTSNDLIAHIMLNDVCLINRHFSHKEFINKNIRKWYYPGYGIRILAQTMFLQNYPSIVGFNNPHLPNSLLKSTINKLWDLEYDILDNTSKNKFRTVNDVNQYIFLWYDIANGNFSPRKRGIGKFYEITNNNKDLLNSIVNQKYKMICINDSSSNFDYEKAKFDIINAFEKILPEKSKFEK